MTRAIALALLALTGCAAASGYDAKRYAHAEAGAPDPETAALPRAARTTIPDPKAKPPSTSTPVTDAGAVAPATP